MPKYSQTVVAAHGVLTAHAGSNGGVTLEMDRTTAAVLRMVLRHVGGPPDGPRGRIDAIGFALDEVDGLRREPTGIRSITGPGVYLERMR